MLEPIWRDRLIAAALRDLETRERLAASGALFQGYNEEMEEVHLENARLLHEAFDAIGWPGPKRLGDDGAAAAFLILQHAISAPDLQRRGLSLLIDAIERGDANAVDAAYLSDRIATMEGKAQIFGTQLDWQADGELGPFDIRDADSVDERRAEIGLPPLTETIAAIRARAAEEGDTMPEDLDARRAAFHAWAVKVGWRKG
jgi:hypothetical protein